MNGPEQIPDMATGLDPREKLIYWLCMQGLGVVVLALWAYTMYLDIKDLKTELTACYKENARLMQKSSDDATSALIDIRDMMRAQSIQQPIQITRKNGKAQ
jgi:hypothetical protein